MTIFAILILGSVIGAIAGLALGDMIKVDAGGGALDLRYILMLLGTIIGYFVARIATRKNQQVDTDPA